MDKQPPRCALRLYYTAVLLPKDGRLRAKPRHCHAHALPDGSGFLVPALRLRRAYICTRCIHTDTVDAPWQQHAGSSDTICPPMHGRVMLLHTAS